MTAVVIAMGCALAFALGWIFYRKPSPGGPDIAGENKIAAEFDAKKAEEHVRIQKLDGQGIVDDLNNRIHK